MAQFMSLICKIILLMLGGLCLTSFSFQGTFNQDGSVQNKDFYIDRANNCVLGAEPISMTLKEAPLQALVTGIGKNYHMNIIGIESLRGTVTGTLEGQDGQEILESLAGLKHFSLQRQGDLYLIDGTDMGDKDDAKQPILLEPQHLRPESLKTVLSSLVDPTNMAVLKENNALLLRVKPSQAQAIYSLYPQLDKEPKQVRLEATILAYEQSYAKELGINWSWLGLSNHGEDTSKAYGAISFGKASDGNPYRWLVKPELSASQAQGKASLIAKPSIMTLNGEEAKILIGDRVPVLEESTTNGEKSSHVRYEDVGIKLIVTPYISPDKTVDASVYAEVSSPTLVSEMKAYKISTRQAQTRVRMKPGEVLVVGGLMDNRSGAQYKKIPFLGDIPLLGKLFQHARKTKDKVEMVMLVKASVL